MVEVDVQNEQAYAVDAARLEAAVQVVAEQQQVTHPAAVTVVVTNDEAVAALNQAYRGVDSPTDILSFPADVLPAEIQDELPYLGDLVIAFPYTLRQAEAEGHALDDSLTLLVVHGMLHLLGYDHDTPETRAAMWEAQAMALTQLNVPLDIVPAMESSLNHESFKDRS